MSTLSALRVKSLMATPGRYPDGDGLHLIVGKAGSGSWMLRIQFAGKRRDLGLGSVNSTTLLDAREKAAEYRKLIRQGIDPVASRKADRQKLVSIPTFREAAEQAHAEFKPGWKNDKHAAQWLATMVEYAFPYLGKTPVDQIDAGMIVAALRPIWLVKGETARRVRQRIGVILDWAQAKGYRTNDAPTRAVGKGLPKQRANDGHFAALPYTDIPALMNKLAQVPTIGRMALRFTILTAARSGEVRGATWSEIDLANRRWTIPGSRMKVGKEHVVPLPAAAVALLYEILAGRSVHPTEIVFPGNGGKPMSDMTMAKALRASTDRPATVHGFRSGFRDWAAENDSAPSEIIEAALAHTPATKVIAAYLRTNYLTLRMPLMDRWAEFAVPSLKDPT